MVIIYVHMIVSVIVNVIVGNVTITVLPRCYALLAVTPPPPIFGRKYCKGLFYLHYTPPPPPPAGRSSRFAVLQFCTYTRVASVEELYLCIKHVENSLRTGLGLFR